MIFKKRLVASVLLTMMASLIMVSSVKAIPPFPNLPPGTVNLTSDFLEDENNFDIISVLSNAPKGYDVHDGAYTGWCIDRRGFGTPTDSLVYLFSSLDLPPISEFPQVHQQDWNRINYIINNIPSEATSRDVQEAIWTFGALGDPFTASRPIAIEIVDDANANGGDFVPTKGQVVAVISFPLGWLTENLQVTFFELMIPAGTGKVTGGGQCITESSSQIPAASFGFNAMWFSKDPAPKGELNYIDHVTGMHVHIHELTYLEVYQEEPGNKHWPLRIAKFGGPCTINGVKGFFADIYVEDHGEPGEYDMFKITLSNGTWVAATPCQF